MNKKKVIAFISTLLFLIILFPSFNAYAAKPSTLLQRRLNNIRTLRANFTQKLYGGNGKVIQASSGSMALKRPGKFRWQITKPSSQLMVADGKRLWIYDKSLAQVTVEKLRRGIGRTPAMILSGSIRALSNYVRVQYKDGWYWLYPRSKQSYYQLIKLRFSGRKLQQMWMFDKLGQKSLLRFSGVRLNRRLSNRLFTFKPPRGVDVIRQSN